MAFTVVAILLLVQTELAKGQIVLKATTCYQWMFLLLLLLLLQCMLLLAKLLME